MYSQTVKTAGLDATTTLDVVDHFLGGLFVSMTEEDADGFKAKTSMVLNREQRELLGKAVKYDRHLLEVGVDRHGEKYGLFYLPYNDATPYVIWFINEAGDTMAGAYYANLFSAVDDFNEKMST